MNRGFLFLIVGGFILSLIGFGMYIIVFGDNVHDHETGHHEIYISSECSYEDVIDTLLSQDIIKNEKSFDWVAKRMNYPNTVEPGKYHITNNISNKALVTELRNGYKEVSVKLPINNIDSKKELFANVSKTIEADTIELDFVFNNEEYLAKKNLTVDNAWAIVMADTYQFNWDTDGETFFNRMLKEYSTFWDENRKVKAQLKNLSPMDCIILGSIIEKESTKRDEYSRIAGVYINRLNKNWPLQADPTVKFALNDPSIRRVLNKHLEVDSPYNTYKNTGLPPGPIGLPEKTTIEAVLDAENHEYMYFCAEDDFSGYHAFSKTLGEHNRNARKYQRALNQNKIY